MGALTRPAPTKSVTFGVGTTHNTMDPGAMSGIQKQIHLPQGSHFGGYTPTGGEIEDEADELRRFEEESQEGFEERQDERQREAMSGSPQERFYRQNPYLGGLLGGGGGGRQTFTAGQVGR